MPGRRRPGSPSPIDRAGRPVEWTVTELASAIGDDWASRHTGVRLETMRIIRWIVLVCVFGLLVNLVPAWAAFLYAPRRTTRDMTPAEVERGPRFDDAYRAHGGTVDAGLGWRHCGYYGYRPPDWRNSRYYAELECGFPLPVVATTDSPFYRLSWVRGQPVSDRTFLERLAELPTRPIWWHAPLNTAVYAVPVLVPFVTIRVWRSIRGRCPKCGYPVASAARCTECGRPTRGPHRAGRAKATGAA